MIEKNVLGFLPKDASCCQKEKLEEVADEVGDLELLAIRKFMEVGYKDFNLRENIPDKYLHDVIGSYNNAKKLR